MRPEIESVRQRLEMILDELEQCCSKEETFSPQLVEEAHALVRLLHEEGFNTATIRQNNKLTVEIVPMRFESLAA